MSSDKEGAYFDRIDNLATDLECAERGDEWTRLTEPA